MQTSSRRTFMSTAAVAAAASIPACSAMSPATASICDAEPYIPAADPLAELIAEYRAQVKRFNSRAEREDRGVLLAATYGPPLDKLLHDPPAPTTPAGVAAAIQLAIEEPDLYAIPPVLAACLRYFDEVTS